MAFSVAFMTTALILLAAALMSLTSLGSLSRVRHLCGFVLPIIGRPLSSLSKHKSHSRLFGQLLEAVMHPPHFRLHETKLKDRYLRSNIELF